MQIEYEATFTSIDKRKIRQKLESVGATLVKSEFLQKRSVFHLPKGHEIQGGWIRVRDEGDRITLSLKVVSGDKIEDQKEICLEVNNFAQTELFLREIGCQKKAYQENKRERWRLDDVEITIDEWPFLEPLVEIEGNSEKDVRVVAERLGFDYQTAFFGSTDTLYSRKYGLPEEVIYNQTPRIVFGEENPFLRKFK